MRDIKFRGKPKKIYSGGAFEWAYGDLVRELETGKTFILDLSHYGPSTILDDVMIEVIPETVGQFTGLKDKNEVEIYEGDIVSGESYLYGYQLVGDKQFKFLGFVKYQTQQDLGLCYAVEDEDGGAWNLNKCVHRNELYLNGEVIGNIYENKEII